jgi:DNA-binding beta-propeller fold protein YncE
MYRFVGGALKIASTAICMMTGLSFMQPAFATLLGVNFTTGVLYSISETNAAKSMIGSTGIAGNAWADIQFGPNGTLYGFTDSAVTPTLYSINPTTAAVKAIGPLNAPAFVFEGALAFSPTGTAYAMNLGSNGNAQLFTINLTTGAATSLGVVTGANDINGLAYRSDGKLVGLDDNSNSLLVIDPVALTATTLAAVPTTVGAVGGMTVENGLGYYVTAGPGASVSGSDDLYSFNLFTGASALIGNLGFTDSGLSGLAAVPSSVPEPPTWGILLAALAMLGAATLRRHPPLGR